MKKKELGQQGEAIAATYLIDAGYTIVKRNWRFSKTEIDIIARKADVLIVVEVKTRSNDTFVEPAATVSEAQMRRLADAYAAYAYQIGHAGECRFDVIGIVLNADGDPTIKHYEDAFWPQ